MVSMENVPLKIKEYPQMRRDIKEHLEQHSKRGLLLLFDLSKRYTDMEKENLKLALQAATTLKAPTAGSEDTVAGNRMESLKEELEEIKLLVTESYMDLGKRLKEQNKILANQAAALENAPRPTSSQAETSSQEGKLLINKLVEIETSLGDIAYHNNRHLAKLEAMDTTLNTVNRNICEAHKDLSETIGTGISDLSAATSAVGGNVADVKTKVETVHTLLEQADHQPTAATPSRKLSYAAVAAAPKTTKHRPVPALHSVVVTSDDAEETSGEVLERVRRAVDATKAGIKIDKIRKAKNQKVILGCRHKADLEQVTTRIAKQDQKLKVTHIENKDPLTILKDVVISEDLNDEALLAAIEKQNSNIWEDIKEEDKRIKIKYKKRTRNPHASHVILQVSPILWHRMVEAGVLHVDLQRVRVEDQSPLIQCSRCLAYGHGRKYCTHDADRCSHCGGPHLRANCEAWLAMSPPECCNCAHAGHKKTDHSAYSDECPVKQKWDYLARSTTSYYTE